MAENTFPQAHPGNQFAKKLDTKELREEAYRQYCKHIADGYPKDCWRFKHPEVTLTWETMEKYIKNDPTEFDPEQKKMAEIDGRKSWIQKCMDSATGADEGKSNTASLQMCMRNIMGWDKRDTQVQNQYAIDVNLVMKRLINHIDAEEIISDTRSQTLELPIQNQDPAL